MSAIVRLVRRRGEFFTVITEVLDLAARGLELGGDRKGNEWLYTYRGTYDQIMKSRDFFFGVFASEF